MVNEVCSKCDSRDLDRGHTIGCGPHFWYGSDRGCYVSGPGREFKVPVCLDCEYAEFYLDIE
ncbi:MAG: hypothetical protein K8R64_01335 [Methanosarcinaceae archaeon]|nr:hypothetical protein [Methanosarcinaceae archaeon]